MSERNVQALTQAYQDLLARCHAQQLQIDRMTKQQATMQAAISALEQRLMAMQVQVAGHGPTRKI